MRTANFQEVDMKKLLAFTAILSLVLIVFSALAQTDQKAPAPPQGQSKETQQQAPAAEQQKMEQPPARQIPGINADDKFPNACVDCHINYTDMNMDTRFSTLMQQWQTKVDERLMDKIKGAAPDGLKLTGKHPTVPKSAFQNIPKSCGNCHGKTSKKAPPAARMTHLIHLTGGDENHFMTLFQGQCTYCHKLDEKTGEWKIPSGPEKS